MRGLIPITWDALSTDKRGFGDELLQGAIDTAKEGIAGTVVDPLVEETYPLIVIDFIAKAATVEIIPGAIDYWMSQSISTVTTGTNETTAYESRVAALQNLRNQLTFEIRDKAAEIAGLLGYRRTDSRRPLLSSIDDLFLTPAPQEFPRPYKQTASS